MIVKYCHLRFKGDEDLLSFTSTLIPDPDAGGGPAAKPGAAEKRKSIDTDGSGPNKRERAELARLQAVMETESSKKMAAALQLQADALVKEAVAAQLNTLLQNIGAYPADHPVRKEMDRQVGELLGIMSVDFKCYTCYV